MICPSRAAVGAMFIVLIGVHCAGRNWIFNTPVMGYETSKLITSDTDLERGNAQRERRKIATTC